HSTISTPLTVLGKYKLKTKGSTVVSSRRVHAMQHEQSGQSPAKPAASPFSTPTRSSATATHGTLQGQMPSLGGTTPLAGLGTKGIAESDAFGSYVEVPTPTRKISHTLDEFPTFPSILADDHSPESRSHNSWGQQSPLLHESSPTKQQKSFTFAPMSVKEPTAEKTSGSKASGGVVSEDSDIFSKRRSMSVVS
ncbi:hypothetical protein EV175_007298, partial [Coemansia sp. RSA 1933]